MPNDILLKPHHRDRRGRFVRGRSGNPAGRPPGLRNKATVAAERMLDDEGAALTATWLRCASVSTG
jgi:hypothetical protein